MLQSKIIRRRCSTSVNWHLHRYSGPSPQHAATRAIGHSSISSVALEAVLEASMADPPPMESKSARRRFLAVFND
jgi:hypothetical protein